MKHSSARKLLDAPGLPDILKGVSAQVAGILCGVFAAFMSVLIYWGGFAEQQRANKDVAPR
jgi:hypothetical protein